MEANGNNDKAGMKAANAEVERIRRQYSNVKGILKAGDPYQFLGEIANPEGTKIQIVRITSQGDVLYEVQAGYDYYVESHKYSSSDKAQQILGKLALDYVSGYSLKYVTRGSKEVVQKALEFTAGAGISEGIQIGVESKGWIVTPDIGDERHIIWRTNKNTGEISNLVVVTNGPVIIEKRYWYVTKKGRKK